MSIILTLSMTLTGMSSHKNQLQLLAIIIPTMSFGMTIFCLVLVFFCFLCPVGCERKLEPIIPSSFRNSL